MFQIVTSNPLLGSWKMEKKTAELEKNSWCDCDSAKITDKNSKLVKPVFNKIFERPIFVVFSHEIFCAKKSYRECNANENTKGLGPARF